MDNQPKVVKTELPIVLHRSDDFRLYFCNHAQLSAGQTGEVQLFFGQMISPAANTAVDSVTVEQAVGVVMTMVQYKQLLDLLQKQLPVLEQVANM